MKINEPMRQLLIDRAQTLCYEARQFPKTRRVAANWICRALNLARREGDVEMYRQICAQLSLMHENEKENLS